jgi:hypothetical protein
MELVRYTGSGDWSALYVDGLLDRVGDHCLVDDRISELAHVTVINSNDFLLGGYSSSDVAKTLTAAQVYGNVRGAAAVAAEDLREQAAGLIREAKRLERIQ